MYRVVCLARFGRPGKLISLRLLRLSAPAYASPLSSILLEYLQERLPRRLDTWYILYSKTGELEVHKSALRHQSCYGVLLPTQLLLLRHAEVIFILLLLILLLRHHAEVISLRSLILYLHILSASAATFTRHVVISLLRSATWCSLFACLS